MTVKTSRLVKITALSAACLAHGAGIIGAFGDPEIQMEGANAFATASLGDSFADLAMGTVETMETEELSEVVRPDNMTETDLPDLTEPEPVAENPPVTPEMETLETAKVDPVDANPPVDPAAAAHPPAEAAMEPLLPQVPVQRSKPSDVIEAQEEQDPVLTRSLRPKTRSKEVEKRAAPKTVAQPKPQKKKEAPQPRGNAQANSSKGSTTNETQAQSQVASAGNSRKAAVGNAAVSNYPGLVMKRISRVSKPRVGSKGTSVVAFKIAGSGALGAIFLARSSGSARLDQAALRVVRKAAPFPPPPPGARRSFSIKIKGR